MAFRTNSKAVKAAVRNYLLENIMSELEEREIATDKPCTAYFDIVKSEKKYIKYVSNYEMFVDWLQGLGGFGDDIYYHGSNCGYDSKCKEILASWLDQTKEVANKYEEGASERLMTILCFRELQYMIKKEGGLI